MGVSKARVGKIVVLGFSALLLRGLRLNFDTNLPVFSL